MGHSFERMEHFSHIHIYTLLQGRMYDRHFSACIKSGESIDFRSCAEEHILNPLCRLAAKRMSLWRIVPRPAISDFFELRYSQSNRPEHTETFRWPAGRVWHHIVPFRVQSLEAHMIVSYARIASGLDITTPGYTAPCAFCPSLTRPKDHVMA